MRIKRFNENQESLEKIRNRIYFAHPINTYNTEYEKICISILENNNISFLNPGTPEQQAKFKIYREKNDNYMKYFKNLVLSCDGVAYLPFRDGKIGAGIVYESKVSNKKGGILYEIDINNNDIKQVDIHHILHNQLSIEETRRRIKMDF